MLWIRKTFHRSEFDWGKVIVHGHSPVSEVHLGERRINVDTGCVYEQMLTAIELPSRRIYSVTRSRDVKQVHLRDFASNRIAIRYRGVVPVYVHSGRHIIEFETIDYSEFGMLMRAIVEDTSGLVAGQALVGQIGSQDATLVDFRGTVVRVSLPLWQLERIDG